METLASLAHGFAVAFTPFNLLWSALGVTVGTAVGVLPGIGPALTVALLLPVTYGLEPTSAFIMFAGIYYGAMYGGSTTAILLNTPGESGSIVTAIDGHEMARQGRGAQALATAAIGSFVAGTIATAALTFVAPLMVKMALLFGPAEYFALMVLALVTVTAVLGDSLSRGLASLFFGLALGTGRHRPPDRSGASDLWHSRTAGRHRHRRGRGRPVRDRRDPLQRRPLPLREGRDLRAQGLEVDEPGRLEALVEALAARHRPGLPDRRPAGRRQRDPDFLSYLSKSG